MFPCFGQMLFSICLFLPNSYEIVSQNGSTLANYVYLSDGTKISATNASGDGLVYLGSFTYKKNGANLAFESAPFGEGQFVATATGFEPHYFLRDHLGSVRAVVADNGEVLERNDYYPFGMRWNGGQLSDNRYRYNGKEEQSFLNLPYNDYGARMYDPRRGGWLTSDPLLANHPEHGPYVFCGNNPIRFVDPNGMEFTDSAWGWIRRMLDNIGMQEADIQNKLADKNVLLASGNLSQRQTDRLLRQIRNLTNSSAELLLARNEIAALEASDQVYDVTIDNSLSTNDMMRAGFIFNSTSGVAEIKMPSNAGLGLFAHELKHAYQFETGVYSSGYRKDGLPFYDQTDEASAYARGAVFGGEYRSAASIASDPLYKNLQIGPMDTTKLPPIILNSSTELQKLANRTKSVFRVNGVTYRFIN